MSDTLCAIICRRIPQQRRVLHIGAAVCGDLLERVRAYAGVAVDCDWPRPSKPRKSGGGQWIAADPRQLPFRGTFDYIVVTLPAQWFASLPEILRECRRMSHRRTRVLLLDQDPSRDLGETLNSVCLEEVRALPVRAVSGIGRVGGDMVSGRARSLMSVTWPNARLVIARAIRVRRPREGYSCSVIVPCRNERQTVEQAASRVPIMGRDTELIFVDDASTDGTGAEVLRCAQRLPDRNIRLVVGPGVNKAQAVRAGVREARGDIVIILDGDLGVDPEELPAFFESLASGRADMANGNRFAYVPEVGAFAPANHVGNIIFARLFSLLLEQEIGDTLCGTKSLFREDFWAICQLRDAWGAEDDWGDFVLLFGASMFGLKIVDQPVNYRARQYGESNMDRRFRTGAIMLRMCWTALWRLRLA